MYTSFSIKNYKAIKELNIEKLHRINLITGLNNTGKTTLLEAMFLHSGNLNPSLTLNIENFRGIERNSVDFSPWEVSPWDGFFSNFDVSKDVSFIGEGSREYSRIVTLKIVKNKNEMAEVTSKIKSRKKERGPSTTSLVDQSKILALESKGIRQNNRVYLIIDSSGWHMEPQPPNPPYPGIILPARLKIPTSVDSDRYGKLELVNKHEFIINALKAIEPNLKKLSIILVGNTPTLHADIGLSRMVPIPNAGEGMARLLSIILAIASCENGVVFIDEIENGLHYSILPKIWDVIGEIAQQFNVQIFSTTHSFDCIKAANTTFSTKEPYIFSFMRLEKHESGEINVVYFDKDVLNASFEIGVEVR